MRVSRRGSKSSGINSSHLTQKNHERSSLSSTVARSRSSRKFNDPCKVCVLNLPFEVGEEELNGWLLAGGGEGERGVVDRSRIVGRGAKLIKDWKTGASKGYAFIQFLDPVYATCCIELCKGRKIRGREVRFRQGVRKGKDNDEVIVAVRKGKGKGKEGGDDEDALLEGVLRDVDEIDGGGASSAVAVGADTASIIGENKKALGKFSGFGSMIKEGEAGPDLGTEEIQDEEYPFDDVDDDDDDDEGGDDDDGDGFDGVDFDFDFLK